MKRRIYWGLGVLIIVLLCVSTFMLMRNTDTSPEKVYKADSSPSPDEDEQVEDNIQDEDTEHEIVDHGDHTHKVPISENEKSPPVPKTSKGGLTYHAELLETNPVKALRLQSEERGHFSAQWIPPFPPDDTEAQSYARAQYLIIYYKSIGETDTPEYHAAVRDSCIFGRVVWDYPYGARRKDLSKLDWVGFDEQPYEVYYPHGFRIGPSDYLPRWRSEAEKRAHYKKSGFYDLFMQMEELQEQGLLPE